MKYAILILTLLCTTAHAGDCRSRHVVAKQVVAVAQVQYAAPLVAQTYYAVGQELRQDAIEERIAAKVAKLMQAQQVTQPQAVTGPCPCVPAGSEAARGVQPQPTPAGPASDIETQAIAVFNRSCVQCHNVTKADGGLDLTNIEAARASACKIYGLVNVGVMPKGGTVSDADAEVLARWWLSVEGRPVK